MPDYAVVPGGVDLPALIPLRRVLHSAPELSGQEENTRDRILSFLQETSGAIIEHWLNNPIAYPHTEKMP